SRLFGQSESCSRWPAKLQGDAWRRSALAGRNFDFTGCRLHGEGVRRRKVWTVFTPTIHRHGDSEFDRSVGRATEKACDVWCCAVRALQLERRNLGREAG